MKKLSYRTDVIHSSKIEESLKIMETRKDIISLGAGEPDFPTPANIVRAAHKAMEDGYTHYSPYGGKKRLREAIAEKFKKENKMDISPDEVMVSSGSKEAILLSIAAVLNHGDQCIIPNPGYLGYLPIINFLGGEAVSVRLKEEDDFEVNPDELKKLITDKTKMIVLNSPANPTGGILRKRTLEEIADIAVEKDVLILSDEAYEKIIYDNEKHVSIGSFNGMKDYVITLHTFSKSYAMCGFRVGYAVAKKELIDNIKKMKICTTICAPVPSQMAAIEALNGKASQKAVEKMVKEYDRRRKMLIKRIAEIPNIHANHPRGAFYMFVNVTKLKMKSEEAQKMILDKAKVFTVPGIEFGEYGDDYIRMSYATNYGKITEAMDRIEKILR
ncbi:MAG TPA: pyridoxal phosphate-dependent aminotransferase [archaeon]|nr:pyridoxal phosphate-dependent aminotransferase [archaeon]